MACKKMMASGWSSRTSSSRTLYCAAQLSAVPVPDPDIQATRKRIVLAGDPPSPIDAPSGCCFHTRCPMACEKCSQERPEFREVEPGHFCACHFAAPNPIKESSIEL